MRLAEALRHAIQAHGWIRFGVPREELGDNGRLDRVHTDLTRLTGTLSIQEVAIRRARPGQELPTAEPGVAAPAHAIRHQRALVLRHGPPHLEEELIMRIITHGVRAKRSLASPLREFIAQQHLMDRVACEAIRGGHAHQRKGRKGGAIPQPIQPGSIERRPTLAVVTIHVILGQMPRRLGRDMRTKTCELLRNRLGVLLADGGDTDIACDFHTVPPETRSTQVVGLPHGQLAIAEGAGTPNPPVAHRHAGG